MLNFLQSEPGSLLNSSRKFNFVKMGGTIFDIEKFDGTGDFCLWKKKMKAIMMQLKVDAVLDENPELSATMTAYEKSEMFKIAYSTIFRHLTDNVLRQVDGLET